MKKYSWVLVLVIITCLVPINIHAQEPQPTISSHVLCEEVIDGKPQGITTKFTTDDTVYSWVEIKEATDKDEVRWVFTGPYELQYSESKALEPGNDQSVYAVLDLRKYTKEDMGDWTVTVSLNGNQAFTDSFSVEPLTGLIWWAPLIVVLIIVILILVAVSVIIVWIIRRKKRLSNQCP
ncbi:MAG: hypothetical protein JXA46_19985 [Dehalococcoidales bacterium]|nr:hypothetical protein [Dehalococcoidales bacterium]